MLELKHTHNLDLPHITLSSPPMQLSPVVADDDELSRAIVSDPENHDDQWELSERPDMGELTEFWTSVEADVENDPEWFRFED